jgi:ribosomal protein L37AE/L43A
MKCPKCTGLMFVERFADYYLTFHAWKCINCGAIMDQTILSNKAETGEWSQVMVHDLLEVSED